MIYNSWREHPDAKMADHLRVLELESVKRASDKMELGEQVHERFAKSRGEGLRKLVETKQGLDEGWISPADQNIKGGGLAARDMPLVRMMAAQMGVDPQDLVARFDPSRSNFYTPVDKRGETPSRPLASMLPKPETQIMGPAQMNTQGGFGV
jgi:hypothetical protein